MSEQLLPQSLYTTVQVDEYLSRISFPVQEYPRIKPAAAQAEEGLQYLAKLQKYQLAAVPFENLSLHYSKTPGVSLNKDELYEKIVQNRRGGYCMELNFFFATILKTMGYEVIQTGARVFGPFGEPGGWGHQLSLVSINNQVYAVDVGFGNQGPTRPLPIISGEISKWGATNSDLRLSYKEPSSPFIQGLWYFEHRFPGSDKWKPLYSFNMIEFFPEDFEIMNFATWSWRMSWFTQQIICTKMVFDEDTEDIIGTVALSDKTLKRRIQGKSELLLECSSENERVRALEDHFGIFLSERERDGIKGTALELKEVRYFADQ